MKRLLATLAGLVLLTGALSACGDSPDQFPRPADAERGERVDTGHFLRELEASFSAGSTAAITFVVRGPVTLRGRGVVKYAKDRMDVDIQFDDWKIKGGTINLRTVNNTTYLQAPESRGLWVDISSGKGDVPGSAMAEEADPRDQISELRKSIREVRFSGDETISGTRTRRYQVVTTSKAGATTGRVITDYWFDRRGRAVRRASDLEGTGEAVFTWADWGTRVRIVQPARRSVVTFEQLQKLQKEQSS